MLEEFENFIQDLVEHYNEFTRGDLEGCVMARCFNKDKTLGENAMLMDAILDEIENRVRN